MFPLASFNIDFDLIRSVLEVLALVLSIVGVKYARNLEAAPAWAKPILERIGGYDRLLAWIDEAERLENLPTGQAKMGWVAERFSSWYNTHPEWTTLSKSTIQWLIENAYQLYKRKVK